MLTVSEYCSNSKMSSIWILLLAVLAVNLVIIVINRALTPMCSVCDECATCSSTTCPPVPRCQDASMQVRALSPYGTYIANPSSISRTSPNLSMEFKLNPGANLEGTLFIINDGTNIFAAALRTAILPGLDGAPGTTRSFIIYYRGSDPSIDEAPTPAKAETLINPTSDQLLRTGWHTVSFSIDVAAKTFTILLDNLQTATARDSGMPDNPFTGTTRVYIGGSRELSGPMKFGSLPGSFRNFKINGTPVTSLEFISVRDNS